MDRQLIAPARDILLARASRTVRKGLSELVGHLTGTVKESITKLVAIRKRSWDETPLYLRADDGESKESEEHIGTTTNLLQTRQGSGSFIVTVIQLLVSFTVCT